MLGKQRVSDCNPGERCATCGWNRDEHERRMQLPLERVGEGPRHKNIAKEAAGRVLPKEYLFFGGDGTHNYFRTKWDGGTVWDWSLPSPYEE